MDLAFRFEDNGTGHGDMVLRFGEQSWTCDSYYFALDRDVLPAREDAVKIRVVLRRLLEQWLDAIERAADGETVFLPYDFSDQGTGWLSCRRAGADIVLSRGWAAVEGYLFCPSRIGDAMTKLSGFHVDGPTVCAPFEEVAAAIRASLAG